MQQVERSLSERIHEAYLGTQGSGAEINVRQGSFQTNNTAAYLHNVGAGSVQEYFEGLQSGTLDQSQQLVYQEKTLIGKALHKATDAVHHWITPVYGVSSRNDANITKAMQAVHTAANNGMVSADTVNNILSSYTRNHASRKVAKTLTEAMYDVDGEIKSHGFYAKEGEGKLDTAYRWATQGEVSGALQAAFYGTAGATMLAWSGLGLVGEKASHVQQHYQNVGNEALAGTAGVAAAGLGALGIAAQTYGAIVGGNVMLGARAANSIAQLGAGYGARKSKKHGKAFSTLLKAATVASIPLTVAYLDSRINGMHIAEAAVTDEYAATHSLDGKILLAENSAAAETGLPAAHVQSAPVVHTEAAVSNAAAVEAAVGSHSPNAVHNAIDRGDVKIVGSPSYIAQCDGVGAISLDPCYGDNNDLQVTVGGDLLHKFTTDDNIALRLTVDSNHNGKIDNGDLRIYSYDHHNGVFTFNDVDNMDFSFDHNAGMYNEKFQVGAVLLDGEKDGFHMTYLNSIDSQNNPCGPINPPKMCPPEPVVIVPIEPMPEPAPIVPIIPECPSCELNDVYESSLVRVHNPDSPNPIDHNVFYDQDRAFERYFRVGDDPFNADLEVQVKSQFVPLNALRHFQDYNPDAVAQSMSESHGEIVYPNTMILDVRDHDVIRISNVHVGEGQSYTFQFLSEDELLEGKAESAKFGHRFGDKIWGRYDLDVSERHIKHPDKFHTLDDLIHDDDRAKLVMDYDKAEKIHGGWFNGKMRGHVLGEDPNAYFLKMITYEDLNGDGQLDVNDAVCDVDIQEILVHPKGKEVAAFMAGAGIGGGIGYAIGAAQAETVTQTRFIPLVLHQNNPIPILWNLPGCPPLNLPIPSPGAIPLPRPW